MTVAEYQGRCRRKFPPPSRWLSPWLCGLQFATIPSAVGVSSDSGGTPKTIRESAATRQPRVAVCVTGAYDRGHPLVLESINAHVVRPLNADVFMAIGLKDRDGGLQEGMVKFTEDEMHDIRRGKGGPGGVFEIGKERLSKGHDSGSGRLSEPAVTVTNIGSTASVTTDFASQTPETGSRISNRKRPQRHAIQKGTETLTVSDSDSAQKRPVRKKTSVQTDSGIDTIAGWQYRDGRRPPQYYDEHYFAHGNTTTSDVTNRNHNTSFPPKHEGTRLSPSAEVKDFLYAQFGGNLKMIHTSSDDYPLDVLFKEHTQAFHQDTNFTSTVTGGIWAAHHGFGFWRGFELRRVCAEMIEDWVAESGAQDYDWVVQSRNDLYWVYDHPLVAEIFQKSLDPDLVDRSLDSSGDSSPHAFEVSSAGDTNHNNKNNLDATRSSTGRNRRTQASRRTLKPKRKAQLKPEEKLKPFASLSHEEKLVRAVEFFKPDKHGFRGEFRSSHETEVVPAGFENGFTSRGFYAPAFANSSVSPKSSTPARQVRLLNREEQMSRGIPAHATATAEDLLSYYERLIANTNDVERIWADSGSEDVRRYGKQLLQDRFVTNEEVLHGKVKWAPEFQRPGEHESESEFNPTSITRNAWFRNATQSAKKLDKFNVKLDSDIVNDAVKTPIAAKSEFAPVDIWVPVCHEYGGLNDRTWTVHYSRMKELFDYTWRYGRDTGRFFQGLGGINKGTNGEAYFAHYVHATGLRVAFLVDAGKMMIQDRQVMVNIAKGATALSEVEEEMKKKFMVAASGSSDHSAATAPSRSSDHSARRNLSKPGSKTRRTSASPRNAEQSRQSHNDVTDSDKVLREEIHKSLDVWRNKMNSGEEGYEYGKLGPPSVLMMAMIDAEVEAEVARRQQKLSQKLPPGETTSFQDLLSVVLADLPTILIETGVQDGRGALKKEAAEVFRRPPPLLRRLLRRNFEAANSSRSSSSSSKSRDSLAVSLTGSSEGGSDTGSSAARTLEKQIETEIEKELGGLIVSLFQLRKVYLRALLKAVTPRGIVTPVTLDAPVKPEFTMRTKEYADTYASLHQATGTDPIGNDSTCSGSSPTQSKNHSLNKCSRDNADINITQCNSNNSNSAHKLLYNSHIGWSPNLAHHVSASFLKESMGGKRHDPAQGESHTNQKIQNSEGDNVADTRDQISTHLQASDIENFFGRFLSETSSDEFSIKCSTKRASGRDDHNCTDNHNCMDKHSQDDSRDQPTQILKPRQNQHTQNQHTQNQHIRQRDLLQKEQTKFPPPPLWQPHPASPIVEYFCGDSTNMGFSDQHYDLNTHLRELARGVCFGLVPGPSPFDHSQAQDRETYVWHADWHRLDFFDSVAIRKMSKELKFTSRCCKVAAIRAFLTLAGDACSPQKCPWRNRLHSGGLIYSDEEGAKERPGGVVQAKTPFNRAHRGIASLVKNSASRKAVRFFDLDVRTFRTQFTPKSDFLEPWDVVY